MDDRMEHGRERVFLYFRTHEVEVTLRGHRPLEIHDSQQFSVIGEFAPEAVEIGYDEGLGENVPKEKSGAVKKRDEYHIRNESRISNMQKGL